MRRPLPVLLVLALGVGPVLAGCSSDDGAERAGPSTRTTGPSASAAGSTTTDDPAAAGCRGGVPTGGPTRAGLRSGGTRRSYLVEVGPAYDGRTPTALILDFHGFGSSGEEQSLYSDLAGATDAVVVTPDGQAGRWSLQPTAANPDVAFTRDLVDAVAEDYCIDRNRVHATGISNGSALSAELACLAPDVVASVALVAATTPPLGCDPATSVPVLAFHGTADRVVPYDGGTVNSSGFNGGLRVPAAEEAIGRWAAQNGCAPDPHPDAVADDVTRISYAACSADVTLYRVDGAGHVWPGAISPPALTARLGPNTTSIDASALISEWFEDHPRG